MRKKTISGIIGILVLFFLASGFLVFTTNSVLAYEVADFSPSGTMAGNYIKVGDTWVLKSSLKGRLESIKNWTADALAWAEKWESDTLAAKAWKSALSNFLNRMAYDTATYLATGDKGQAPMFQTENFGDFLKNAADYAAGDFLEAFGESGAFGIKFNVCEPDPRVKINIGLGLYRQYRPAEPDCTFSEMKNNWEEALNDPNFLNNFQAVFDPRQNDLGIALTMQTGMEEYIARQTEEAEKEYLKSDGWKDVTEDISGAIKTPSSLVFRRAQKAIDDSTISETSYTGNIIADAIDVFVNTLIGKLADKWFGQGLVLKFPDNGGSGWSGISDYYSGAYQEGITGAKDRFLSISEAKFNVRGDYEILGELTSCPNPENAGPTNCVITEKFRQAISEKMMVGEAMEQGFLNPEGLFGFRSDGLEPNFNEGYPYRSMLILRKFRIIPIGWELAAERIENDSAVNRPRNLGDMVACFDENDKYGGFYQEWCEGLVDPTWVLKAPLNFCKKEGPGPEIVSRNVVGQEEESELAISRNTNYCADEQACIKEGDDGSCEIFGYCTKEKRKWDFGGESCDPNFNTCDTFKSREGKTISYLENTLNYIGCNAENAGCTAYCRDYDYENNKYTCGFDSGEKIYLDAGVVACDKEKEGCQEFIRLKSGSGANLLSNSSFEEEGTPGRVEGGFHGQWSRQAGNVGFSPELNAVNGLSFEGMAITFSLYLKGCGDSIVITVASAPGQDTSKTINSGDDWQRFSVTHESSIAGDNAINANLSGGSASCLIDAVKIEFGEKATPYSAYRENNLVYEKIIPEYMEQACYVNALSGDYNLKDDYAPECLDFARKCNPDELGCDLYTAIKDRMSVAGKAVVDDYCPSECVGYNEYFQMETAFDSQQPQYFVPESAQKCGSAAAGCDEFTNLDKLGLGAEAREYYSELKQCRKPDDSCREFYVWEGSGESGYQLRVYQMEADDLSGVLNYGPKQTRSIVGECNETIFNKPATDPDYNPDCREFYNKNGQITYRLYSLTISCSDNCHPYRRSENNIVSNITEANNLCVAECGADTVCVNQCGSRVASLADGNAVFCQNGGTWNNQHERCLYNAIPDEGKKCSSSQAGCREYSGSSGANMRFIVNDDIESGTTDGWIGDLPIDANPSNESLIMGGKSLYVSGGSNRINKILGTNLQKDRSYYLSFIAKGSGNFNNIGFGANTGASVSFELGGSTSLSSDWKIYQFNLASFNNTAGDYVINDEEKLFIGASGAFYIDNIRLIEIVDRYFLIKNSWDLGACLYDTAGNPRDKDYNLGCEAYRDNEGQLHNLRRFTKLCQDSAVGCDLMIDTYNSTQFEGYTSNTNPSVSVPKDSYAFIVYDDDKLCNGADKGCEKLGDPYYYENNVIYRDIYLKNDPDKYGGINDPNEDGILCNADASECESWQKSGANVYFKDPGDHICERKAPYGELGVDWYKKEVKKCDTNNNGWIEYTENNVCLADSDCEPDTKCLLDKNLYVCPKENKTIGTGGAAGAVFQPHIDEYGRFWVGLCPASEAGCTEYIDPLSRFSANFLFNPDFKDIDSDGNPGDGWEGASQELPLEPNTLYVFRTSGGSDGASLSASGIRFLNQNNIFASGTVTSIDLDSSTLVISREPVKVTISGGAVEKTIEIKKAIVDYQIKSKIDKTSCNGLVNFEEGCVLFNERSYEGGIYNKLVWDANKTYEDEDGVVPVLSDSNNSQVLLKVDPNRGCETWLACRSYIKDENDNNVCYNIGLCDKFDENGNCANIVETDTLNNTVNSGKNFSNYSGYFKAGYLFSPYNEEEWIDHNGERNDYLSFDSMEQVGEVVKIPNGDFELFGSNGFPISWQMQDSPWTYDQLRVINNPWEAEKEGIKYPVNGRSFLKFSPQMGNVMSDFIDVEANTTYVLSAMLNTMNFFVEPIGSDDLAAVTAYVRAYDKDGGYIERSPGSSIDDHGFKECLHQELGHGCGVYLSQRTDWTSLKARFKLGDTVAKIKIELNGNVWGWDDSLADWPDVYPCYSENSPCIGSAYVDNIQIKPVLQKYRSKYEVPLSELNSSASNPEISWMADRWQVGWFEERSCRLYPEDDALSCEYLNDSGVKIKGLHGYCLEYDRYPGSEDACLLWYPVDKVKGDGIEEGAGYIGKYPVYYTVQAAKADYTAKVTPEEELVFLLLPNDQVNKKNYVNFTISDLGLDKLPKYARHKDNYVNLVVSHYPVLHGFEDGCPSIPNKFAYVENEDGKYVHIKNPKGAGDFSNVFDSITCGTSDAIYTELYFDSSDYLMGIEWIACNSDCFQSNAGVKEIEYTYKKPYAAKIVQTVTPFGENKFWSGRVYEGSDHELACNFSTLGLNKICNYTSDAVPFGSVTPPGPTWDIVGNPYEWNKPLYYELPETGMARMGQEYKRDDIKSIFAQSYGAWSFQSGYYCADGTFPGGADAMTQTCEHECTDSECVMQESEAAIANNEELICNCEDYSGNFRIACNLYQDLVYRCGESGGISHWAGDLDRGDTLEEVKINFMTAYKAHCSAVGVTVDDCNVNSSSCHNCNTALLCDADEYYVPNTTYCAKSGICLNTGLPCNAGLNDCPGSSCEFGGKYIKTEGELWNPPNLLCDGARPDSNEAGSYCYILPQVKNLKVDKYAVNNSNFINLTFNSIVDSQQLPLVMYSVDWGDDDKTVVSGVEMRDRPNTSDPHSVYHLYSYWELRKKSNIECVVDEYGKDYCEVTIKVRVKDNWGIYSSIEEIGPIRVYRDALEEDLQYEPPCIPATCDTSKCGIFEDGCGGELTCDCPTGSSCSNGVCVTDCVPTTCDDYGYVCGGPYNDGCNGLINTCGTCNPPQTCSNGQCVDECVENCTTGPGCKYSLSNGVSASGTCCDGKTCFTCKSGWFWDSVDEICKIGCYTGPGCRASLANGYIVPESQGNCEDNECWECNSDRVWDGSACVLENEDCEVSCVGNVLTKTDCSTMNCAHGCNQAGDACVIQFPAMANGELLKCNCEYYYGDDPQALRACQLYQELFYRCGENGGIMWWADDLRTRSEDEVIAEMKGEFVRHCNTNWGAGTVDTGDCDVNRDQCDECNTLGRCSWGGYENFYYKSNSLYCYTL